MESINVEVDAAPHPSEGPLPFARSYQLEALEKAMNDNTIVFLETGAGKTLIAVMLLRSYAYLLRKPLPFIAVFLVPKVVLVHQQAEVVKMHTDLEVGTYWGEKGVDFWDAATWKREIDKHEEDDEFTDFALECSYIFLALAYQVLVMTPQILLDGLRHCFFKLEWIKLLILDECHHARGNHAYARIMKEFYHPQLSTKNCRLPRVLGMTASPIKSKGAKSELDYWKKIHELENVMFSKVYTCENESILAGFIPFSTPKFRFYQQGEIPIVVRKCLEEKLKILKAKHICSFRQSDHHHCSAEAVNRKISRIYSTLIYCLDELGIWLAFKAAQILSSYNSDMGKSHVDGEKVVRKFSLDALIAFKSCMKSELLFTELPIGDNVEANVSAGLLTPKIVCLIRSLLEYRDMKDIRSIIFVQRVITALVLQSLLNELLPKHNSSWKTKHIAGHNSGLQSQTSKTQHEIVEEFRTGMVNVIIATSILEEGLDIKSCNLVIRFDPSDTVSSFIQSRGRARMQNSDYLLMVKSDDISTRDRLVNYIASGNIMRREALLHASVPCSPLPFSDYETYQVESTGAIVSLSSSVSLLYFYCSRLPSDGYFKSGPRCVVNKQMGSCTLYLPKSCPIQSIFVQGNANTIKQKACLEACKQLHGIGALTDNLLPGIVVEEAAAQEIAKEPYNDEQPIYFPPELVNQDNLDTKYYCYLIQLKQNFDHDIPVHDVLLLVRSVLQYDISNMNFNLDVDRGVLHVKWKYIGEIHLTPDLVLKCRRFQVCLFKVLGGHHLSKLEDFFGGFQQLGSGLEIDYLLLPSLNSSLQHSIDWITSLLLRYPNLNDHVNYTCKEKACAVQTKSGLLCRCMLNNSLVYTTHNGKVYCITGTFDDLDGNSVMRQRNGSDITYRKYNELRHDVKLCFAHQLLLKGRHIFPMRNYLLKCGQRKEKESQNAYVELPPELCCILMSRISLSTVYSFTFIPSVMHQLESLLIAVNLKRMHLGHCLQNINVPTTKVLEAITTRRCQEKVHLESLETLGDSFLKYAVSQQLFKTHQNHHEGLLSIRKEKIVSNAALCKLGCESKLPGFIRNDPFEPKMWMAPGDNSGTYSLSKGLLSGSGTVYITGTRKVKSKTVADAVEALIGAYISAGGEMAGLLFMDWIGIKADFINIPYQRHFQVQAEKHVHVRHFESLLNYSFADPSLLLEALTHGSYMLPEIPRCYQRLEFLGDAVLDYLITLHLYNKHPGLSPGLLTDMRSASVNNDCYARSAIKEGLHKHILHVSQKLREQIEETIENIKEYSSELTFGWESEASFPKVLGDIIESLAGAILVDSGYNKEVVFQSIRPLLEPFVSPETIRYHPVRELNELCQKQHFDRRKSIASCTNGKASVTVEVEAEGEIFKHTATAADKKTAEKVASKEVLKALKGDVRVTGAKRQRFD